LSLFSSAFFSPSLSSYFDSGLEGEDDSGMGEGVIWLVSSHRKRYTEKKTYVAILFLFFLLRGHCSSYSTRRGCGQQSSGSTCYCTRTDRGSDWA
jgi:hypothetical protein